jgi:hypothetical protein
MIILTNCRWIILWWEALEFHGSCILIKKSKFSNFVKLTVLILYLCYRQKLDRTSDMLLPYELPPPHAQQICVEQNPLPSQLPHQPVLIA